MKVPVVLCLIFTIIVAFEAPLYPRTPEKRIEIQSGYVQKDGYGVYGYEEKEDNDDKSSEEKFESESESKSKSSSGSKSKSDSHSHSHEHKECPEATTEKPATCPAQVRPAEACPISDRVSEIPLFVANGAVATTGVIAFLLGLNQKRPSYICDCNTGSLQFFEPFRINDLFKRKRRGLGFELLILRWIFPKDTFSFGFNSNSCTNICIRDENDVYWTPSTFHANNFEFFDQFFGTRDAGVREARDTREKRAKKRKSKKKAKAVVGGTPVVTPAPPPPNPPVGGPNPPVVGPNAPVVPSTQAPIVTPASIQPPVPVGNPTGSTPNFVNNPPTPAGNTQPPPPTPAGNPSPPTPAPANVPEQSTPNSPVKPNADPAKPPLAPPPPPPNAVPLTPSQATVQGASPSLLSESVNSFGGLFRFIEGYIIPFCNKDDCHQYLLLTPWSGSLVGKLENGTFVGKYNNRCIYTEFFDAIGIDGIDFSRTAAGTPPVPSMSEEQAQASIVSFSNGIQNTFVDDNPILDPDSEGRCGLIKVKAISCHGCGVIKGDKINKCYRQEFE